MTKLFCIDFGSGYTKVALRTTRDTDSRLLNVSDQVVSGFNFIVPTLVLVDKSAGKTVFECGLDVVDRTGTAGGPIQIFGDWKRWLFDEEQMKPTGFRALFASPHFAHLAQQYQVAPTQVDHLRRMVDAAHGMFGVQPPLAERGRVKNARILSEQFLRYLRTVTLAEARKVVPRVRNLEDVPAVITVPAFGTTDEMMSTLGVESLVAAARAAGWVMKDPCPIVSEPFANAIGLLTRGRNRLTKPPHGGRSVRDFREMCGKPSPINSAMMDGGHHQPYRSLVVDVGAFTTDVAVLTYDCRDHTFDLFSSDRGRMRMESERVGVADLDRQLAGAISPELKQQLPPATAVREWDRLRKVVYGSERARSGGLLPERILAESREAVDHCLSEFGRQVSDVVERACAGLPEAQMQEVFLTGGGCNIPAVCQAVESRILLPGRPPTFAATPIGHTTLKDATFRTIDPQIFRGATALGGASIYFDARD